MKLPGQKCSEQAAGLTIAHDMALAEVRGSTGSSSVFLSTRKGSPCRVGPREGSPGWWAAGVSEVEGEAEAAGLF